MSALISFVFRVRSNQWKVLFSSATKSFYLSFLYYVQHDQGTCANLHTIHRQNETHLDTCHTEMTSCFTILPAVRVCTSKWPPSKAQREWKAVKTKDNNQVTQEILKYNKHTSLQHCIKFSLNFTGGKKKLILLSSKVIYERKHLRFVLTHKHTLAQNTSRSLS